MIDQSMTHYKITHVNWDMWMMWAKQSKFQCKQGSKLNRYQRENVQTAWIIATLKGRTACLYSGSAGGNVTNMDMMIYTVAVDHR